MERGVRVADRYELVERLGRGGMGEVWAGWDQRLHRAVAVKLLAPGDPAESQLRQRFEREAVAGAQISHSNVVAFFDSGVHDDLLFLVMEKVEGASLAHLIDRDGRIDVGRALSLAAQICDALSAAHAAGIVHYDLKPQNVMITGSDTVKVVDFGIAGFLQATFSLAHSSALAPAGTPQFAAPEQFGSERGGPSADLYALGGVLYAMLTGQPPFMGQNAWAIIARKMSEDAPRLDTLRPDLPVGVGDLVAHLLERDPRSRPADAGEVGRRLRGIRALATGHGPTEGAPPATVLDDSSAQRAGGLGDGDVVLLPPLDRAVRLARCVEDPAVRAGAMFWIADALARQDVDAARRFTLREVGDEHLGWVLLELAEQAPDAGGARQLLTAAEPLLSPHGDAARTVQAAAVIARVAPDRAGPWVERVARQLPVMDGEDLPDVVELAAALAAREPSSAQLLLPGIEAKVRELCFLMTRESPGGSWLWATAASATRVSPVFGARIVDMVEQAVLSGPDDDRGRWLRLSRLAEELAENGYVARRVAQIVAHVQEPHLVALVWKSVLCDATYEDSAETRSLLDAAERAVLGPRRTPPPQLPAQQPKGRFTRLWRQLVDDHATGTAGTDTHVAWLVEGVARHDLLRAERSAGLITSDEWLAYAYLRLARAAADQRTVLVGRYLERACLHVLAKVRKNFGSADIRSLIEVFELAAAHDPALVRRTEPRLRRPAAADADAWGSVLATAAKACAATDPGLAEQLLAQAEYLDDGTGATGRAIGEALIALTTTAYADGSETRNTEMARRILRTTAAAGETNFWSSSVPSLHRHNPAVLELLLRHHRGEGRDHLIALAAPLLAPEDPDRAEELVRSLADPEDRDDAFADSVVALAQHGSRTGHE
ncbi:protein kinase domain-containing protein [Streptomyces bungoensis]|uniref:serine/threonine-protein kinase n=1 Tax=Streptomyces bungoensis TaxID=285568 RepID=UPI000B05F3DF|nr:serine/threonine-protein kinase [Streptomyces bungoensis]